MPLTKTLFMETTQIDPRKTAAEIQAVLVKAGAGQIATTYKDGKAVGMAFTLRAPNGNDIPFALPVRVEPVFKLLVRRKGIGNTVRLQAERVAWRQLLRWIQAQVAMIETGMVENLEVFLPYRQDPNGSGKTLYELMAVSQFKALPAGPSDAARPNPTA